MGNKRKSKDRHGSGRWNLSVNSNTSLTGPTRR